MVFREFNNAVGLSWLLFQNRMYVVFDAYLFVIALHTRDQMINSQPPASLLLRPERLKWFPCSSYIQWKFSYFPKKLCPRPPFLSISLSISFLLPQANGNSLLSSDSSATCQIWVCSPKSKGYILSSFIYPMEAGPLILKRKRTSYLFPLVLLEVWKGRQVLENKFLQTILLTNCASSSFLVFYIGVAGPFLGCVGPWVNSFCGDFVYKTIWL